jgi:twitching motility protein PilU
MTMNELLGDMAKRDASDLYIKVGTRPMYRVHGELAPSGDERVTMTDAVALANQLLTEEQRIQLRDAQTVDIACGIPGLGRFRINVYVQRGSVAIVARRVKLDVPSFADLGLPEILKDLVTRKRGLVLVTGPTGSGKSTTLAAMIDHRNSSEHGQIITIEDPIEFLHPDKKSIVSQREVATDTPTFHDALRGALRQAPDVILIGEMRDRESAEAALHFAETGHLVLSTLHSNNSAQTLERILAFFSRDHTPEILHRLSLTLEGIVSQRLIPRSDQPGRVAALEVMVSTPRMRELIKKGDITGIRQSMTAGTQEGMQTFDQALYILHQRGQIGLEDALRMADSPNDLRLKMKGLA